MEACTNYRRVAIFFRILGEKHLWPAEDIFHYYSVSDLAEKYISALENPSEPIFPGEDTCPLRDDLDWLVRRIRGVLEMAQGLRLDPGIDHGSEPTHIKDRHRSMLGL